MKSFSEVLVEYQKELEKNAEGTWLGDPGSALKKNLEIIIERNRRRYYVITGLMIIIFLLAIFFIWNWHGNTAVLISAFSGAGITIPWAMNSIISLWKDISNAETLHILVSDLNDEEITRDIVKALAAKL